MTNAARTRPRSRVVGLVGSGIQPSLSPALHELEGARHGMAYVYRLIEIAAHEGTEEHLRTILEAAWMCGLDGLNVTHPVKQTVLPLLDDLAPSAARVGAVNTVVLQDGRSIGHNTDMSGFAAALDSTLAGAPAGFTVLCGAGGAGAAVAHALLDREDTTLAILDTDQRRADELVDRLDAPGRVTALTPTTAEQALTIADTLVNATPLGMHDHPGMAVDPAIVPRSALVADIVYRPVETQMIRRARERGMRVMTGLGMAMNQAADAFEIFTQEKADRRAMLGDLTDLVADEATRAPDDGATRKGQER
ncbi:shikimate dehydrogenase [Demequina zhanjiangensis]|uniref:Shikimate dehydrogenase (NADP(+)) n=1 Tax=Demequina zhanjiangensis TaxID=3051659 RepID=A0ABT8G3B2_9MICO|nr:shikimate dehydrogenase [Demequina sp. SYSU T00b26]MDN4473631.1 shikimate dehydrogenase [Demequina sp. SYSU T00b26]